MNKKAFTLIELLAVIVILAIIALIAVPIVIHIINDSKKESLQRSIDLYIDTVQKRIIQENMKTKYDPEKCEIQENGNVKCYVGEEVLKTSTGEEELKIEMNGKKPEAGTITFKTQSTNTNSNKITYTEVVLEGMEYTLTSDGKVTSKAYVPPTPAIDVDYRGYYADVDGDGNPDGIIYADLGANIQYPQSGDFYNEKNNWGQGTGTYSYAKGTNLNEYTVSSNTYKKNDGFGENKIIKLKKDKGNPRFYVMALEDFRTGSFEEGSGYTVGTYFWYKKASGKMSTYATDTSPDFGAGYTNTGNIIEIWKKNGEGTGSYSGATQDEHDIWGYIQDKYKSKEKWYIPSRGEWGAFADYFKKRTENGLTHNYESGSYVANSGNYNSLYGLSNYYWSSSQDNSTNAWRAGFSGGYMSNYFVGGDYYVRLGATF